jgi:geranylgeranyl diphosphate synthase type I
MDRDETRRHRPTAWRVFGMGDAILAGDALVTLALQLLATGCGDTGEQTATLCAAVQALIDGQHADLAFEARDDVRLSECVHMAEGKTGALIRAACALGALAGGAGSDQVEQLAQFGASLGLAFQVVDDLAGLWGDPEVTGKPAHSDLRNRKKSLPVVAALESGTASGQELAAWFAGSSEPTETELARAATLVEEAGGGAWSQTQVDLLRSRALRFLGFAGPSPLAAAELSALGEHIVGPPARAGR